MAKLRSITGGKRKEKTFSLVYGMRLYPAATVQAVSAGETRQRDGVDSRVPLHLIEGTREQIRAQLLASIDAFFEIHAETITPTFAPPSTPDEETGDSGC